MATAEALELLTAEEFARRPDPGHLEELVRGRPVASPFPDRLHGLVCARASFSVDQYVDAHDLGRTIIGGSAVITERGPDTVRGADVAYYSFDRLPRGALAAGYGPEVPELVIEVRSSSDSWRDLLIKVGEYLAAGVVIVVVLDPRARKAHVYRPDDEPLALGPDDELTFPGVLDGLRVAVGRLFD